MTERNKSHIRAALAIVLVIPAACSEMRDGSRTKPLEPALFFRDGMSARSPVVGTVPREGPPVASPALRSSFEHVEELPVPLTAGLLARGEESYNIHCSVCHGATGHGRGMIVRRGFTAPPSFHSPALRGATIGHFVDVITNGRGAMYSYSEKLALTDRWAVAAYIRALQLSQYAAADSLPEDDLRKVREAGDD